jgi:hypothetical protein
MHLEVKWSKLEKMLWVKNLLSQYILPEGRLTNLRYYLNCLKNSKN